MKSALLSALILLLSGGYALAGAGAPVPESPEGGPPSGRPGAVLDEAACESVWAKAQGNAAAYVSNLEMVDTNGDGTVSEEEFKKGCSEGWIQPEPGSKPPDSGGGQTPQEPTEDE